jgi:hypothetical protein
MAARHNDRRNDTGATDLMATGTAKSSQRPEAASPAAGKPRQYDQFIDQQLGKTCLRVKLVELGAYGMGLLGFLLAYLLLVVLLDHWVIELGFWGRLLALLALLGSVGWFLVRHLGPILIRRINPLFAAHAVEQTEPRFKNSLINYLMPSPGSRSNSFVYSALRQRAALDLRTVNPDNVVDWTHFIRIGYAVVALMVLLAAYTILSPKNVFQTMFRIAAPWADIARPACVRISDVQPGDHQALRGQQVRVSARIDGAASTDLVVLRYTTNDAQIVEKAVPMESTGAGLRYECLLPPEPAGVQQDVTYRIEAGDASTIDFRVEVLPAPTILVQQIKYTYPAYTGLPPQTVERQGDIHAPEGTQVSIVAQASRPIGAAHIEFDPADGSENANQGSKRRTMQSEDQRATYAFPLRWIATEAAPQYSSYQLTFTSRDKLRNQQPIVHEISVVPDLPPEIAILTPEERDVEVPEDRTQRIEVRGLDPDYGLTRLLLHAEVEGEELFQRSLFDESAGQAGQVVATYDFQPRQLGLSAGTRVTVWATAEDGRKFDHDRSLGPNQARSGDYQLLIVPAEDNVSKAGDEDGSTNPQNPSDQSDENSPDPTQPENRQPAEPAESPDAGQDGEQGASSGAEAADGEQQNGETQDDAASQSGQQESGEQPADQAGGESEDPEAMPQQIGGAGEPDKASASEGEQQNGGVQGSQSSGDPNGGESSEQAQSGGQSKGSSQQPDEASSSSGDSNGNRQPSDDVGSSQDLDQNPSGANRGANDAPREPLHDGEVFQEALEHFQQRNRQNGDSSQPSASSQGDGSPGGENSDSGNSQPADELPQDRLQDGSVDPSQVDSGGNSGQPGSNDDSATRPEADAQNPAGEPSTGRDAQAAPPSANPTSPDGTGDSPPGMPNRREGDQTPGESASNASPTDDGGGQPDESGRAENERDTQSPDSQSRRDDGAADGGRESGNESNSGSESSEDRATGSTQDPDSSDSNSSGASNSENGSAGSNGKTNQDAPSRDGASNPSESGDTPANSDGAPSEAENQDSSKQQASGDDAGSPSETGNSPDSDSPSGQATADDPADSGEASDHSPSNDGMENEGNPENARGGDAPATDDSAGQSQSSDSPDSEAAQDQTSESTGGGGGATGGGGTGPSSASGASGANEVPDGDPANLDFARQATDMVLERLKDQRQDPDPELLEKLRWTPQQLRQFVERWETLKKAAREDPADAQAELDDALRSLGLRREGPQRQARRMANEAPGGLRDTGGRTRPPAAFLDQYNAYKKGAARLDSQPQP